MPESMIRLLTLGILMTALVGEAGAQTGAPGIMPVDTGLPGQTPVEAGVPVATPEPVFGPTETLPVTTPPPNAGPVDAGSPGQAPVDAGAPVQDRPTAEDWRDLRWWAKIDLGYGMIRQDVAEGIADSFKAHWVSPGFSSEAAVAGGGLAFGGEIGRRLTPNLGLSAALELFLPGGFTATARDASGWWLTRKMSQTLVPLSVNMVGFLPIKGSRAYASVGGGLCMAWLTQTTDIRRTVIEQLDSFGLGFCARGTCGIQLALDGRHSVDIGLRAQWMKVPVTRGTFRDASGSHEGEMLTDETGSVFMGGAQEAGRPGTRRFAPDFLDLGLRLALTYYY